MFKIDSSTCPTACIEFASLTTLRSVMLSSCSAACLTFVIHSIVIRQQQIVNNRLHWANRDNQLQSAYSVNGKPPVELAACYTWRLDCNCCSCKLDAEKDRLFVGNKKRSRLRVPWVTGDTYGPCHIVAIRQGSGAYKRSVSVYRMNIIHASGIFIYTVVFWMRGL